MDQHAENKTILPDVVKELDDLREWKKFKVGQLVEVSVDAIIYPWRKNKLSEIGVITGFFYVSGTSTQVKGSPRASSFIGAHVLIKSIAHKYHLDHLTPV
jgi:hypothetical protein